MHKKSKRLILEIGCGCIPWPIVRLNCFYKTKNYEPFRTSIMDEYANLLPGDKFIGLDNDEKAIRDASKKLTKLIKKYPNVGLTQITLEVGDGTNLNFANKSADVVILADVLSAPQPGTTPISEPYPEELCIEEGDKWGMIKESLRVLKDGGVLVIDICQTPCYAKETMQRIKTLVKKGQIQLVKQCGKFVDSDNWHLYHAVFQKNPGPTIETAELIPWSPAQKKYIGEYASSWFMC